MSNINNIELYLKIVVEGISYAMYSYSRKWNLRKTEEGKR